MTDPVPRGDASPAAGGHPHVAPEAGRDAHDPLPTTASGSSPAAAADEDPAARPRRVGAVPGADRSDGEGPDARRSHDGRFRDTAAYIPLPLRVTSELCARLLIIAAAVGLLVFLVIQLRIVIIPVSIALLLCALLAPAVHWLTRRRVPRGPATAIVLVAGLVLIGGLLSFVVNTFIGGFPDLERQLTASLRSIQQFLARAPFDISSEQLQNLPAQLGQLLTDNQASLTTGALTTAATVTEIAAGAALALFSLIFFLYDGPRIWRFLLRGTPKTRRARIDVAGRRSFATLVGYTRATVLVAFVDAIGIGIGLWIVGVPLVVPLAALVFLGAFVPTVGAVVTGAVAVLIALVANGLIPALIVLGVVVGVQQLEGHVLQPLLLGRAVKLHPLAVVLSVAAGVVIAGIPGALLAVPLLAVVSAAIRSLSAEEEPVAQAVDAVDPRQGDPTLARRPGLPSRRARLRLRLR